MTVIVYDDKYRFGELTLRVLLLYARIKGVQQQKNKKKGKLCFFMYK